MRTVSDQTKEFSLALVNEVRRQNGLGPCQWEDLEERHQLDYALQAQAVVMSYQHQLLQTNPEREER